MSDIPLQRYGLEEKWPRLSKLQAEVADLTHQAQAAAAEVAQLEASLPEARNEDLQVQASALRSGKEVPKRSREETVQSKLESARRTQRVLQRVVEDASSDLAVFRQKHRAELYADLQERRRAKRTRMAERARLFLQDYGEDQDLHYLLKDLTPPPEPDENAPVQRLTQVFAGDVQTTQSGGIPRGHVESALSHLIDLAPADEGASDAA